MEGVANQADETAVGFADPCVNGVWRNVEAGDLRSVVLQRASCKLHPTFNVDCETGESCNVTLESSDVFEGTLAAELGAVTAAWAGGAVSNPVFGHCCATFSSGAGRDRWRCNGVREEAVVRCQCPSYCRGDVQGGVLL